MNLQLSLNNIAVEVNGNIITPFLLITVQCGLGMVQDLIVERKYFRSNEKYEI